MPISAIARRVLEENAGSLPVRQRIEAMRHAVRAGEIPPWRETHIQMSDGRILTLRASDLCEAWHLIHTAAPPPPPPTRPSPPSFSQYVADHFSVPRFNPGEDCATAMRIPPSAAIDDPRSEYQRRRDEWEQFALYTQGRQTIRIPAHDEFTQATQPTQPSTEAPPMIKIPHPLAEFDQDTMFLFFDSFNAHSGAYSTVENGQHASGHPHSVSAQLARETPIERESILDYMEPDSDHPMGPDTTLQLSYKTYMIGIPATPTSAPLPAFGALSPEEAARAIVAYNQTAYVYTTTDTVYPLHRNAAERRRRKSALGEKPVIAFSNRPVEDFHQIHDTPVQSIAEAWERCSDSWKSWAKERSVIPLDILMFITVQTFPHVFGVRDRAQFEGLWGAPEMVRLPQNATRSVRLSLRLTAPQFNPETKALSLYRTPLDMLRDRRTEMKVGKALKHIAPNLTDQNVKDFASDIIGALTPPEFKIGFTKEDFDWAYKNGPSSCMTYDSRRYKGLKDAPSGTRPTDAFITGDIGVATLSAGDKATARALVVESTKKFIRLYMADYATDKNGSRALRRRLEQAGYTEDTNGLRTLTLKKIEVDTNPMQDDLAQYFKTSHTHWNHFLINHGLPTHLLPQFMSVLDMKVVAAPYIDYNNPVVEDTGEGLFVTRDLPMDIETSLTSTCSTLVNNPHVRIPARIGRSYYESGVAILANLMAAAEWVREQKDLLTGRPVITQAPATPMPQPPQPPQPAPIQMTGSIDRTLLTAATRIEAAREQSADPDEPVPLTYPVWTESTRISNVRITNHEADLVGEETGIALEIIELPSGQEVLVDEDDIITAEDGTEMIRYVAGEYGYVYVDGPCGYYPEDEVITLEDGGLCLRDEAIQIDGDWYHEEDDDICFVDRHQEYALREDCVYTDGGWELASECFRLPNNEYIHEEDLSRAS